jgi:hypothetical protein
MYWTSRIESFVVVVVDSMLVNQGNHKRSDRSQPNMQGSLCTIEVLREDMYT